MDRVIEEQEEITKIVGEKPLVGKVKKAAKLNGDVLDQEISSIHDRFSTIKRVYYKHVLINEVIDYLYPQCPEYQDRFNENKELMKEIDCATGTDADENSEDELIRDIFDKYKLKISTLLDQQIHEFHNQLRSFLYCFLQVPEPLKQYYISIKVCNFSATMKPLHLQYILLIENRTYYYIHCDSLKDNSYRSAFDQYLNLLQLLEYNPQKLNQLHQDLQVVNMNDKKQCEIYLNNLITTADLASCYDTMKNKILSDYSQLDQSSLSSDIKNKYTFIKTYDFNMLKLIEFNKYVNDTLIPFKNNIESLHISSTVTPIEGQLIQFFDLIQNCTLLSDAIVQPYILIYQTINDWFSVIKDNPEVVDAKEYNEKMDILIKNQQKLTMINQNCITIQSSVAELTDLYSTSLTPQISISSFIPEHTQLLLIVNAIDYSTVTQADIQDYRNQINNIQYIIKTRIKEANEIINEMNLLMSIYGTPYPNIIPEHQQIINKYGNINYNIMSEDYYKVIMNDLKNVRGIVESKNRRGSEISNKIKELLNLYSTPNPILLPEHQQLLTQLSSMNFNNMNDMEYNQVIENINDMKLTIMSKLAQYSNLSQLIDELEQKYNTCSTRGVSLSSIENEYNEVMLKRLKLINNDMNEMEIQLIISKINEINPKIDEEIKNTNNQIDVLLQNISKKLNEFYQLYSTSPPIENISVYFECYENVNKWLLNQNRENAILMEAEDQLTLITNSVQSYKKLINQSESEGTFNKVKEQLAVLDQLMKDTQAEYDISDTDFLSRYLDLHTKISLVTPETTTSQQFAELYDEITSFITELNNYKTKIDKIKPILLDIQNDITALYTMIDNNKMYNLNDFLANYQLYCDWVSKLNIEKAEESECIEMSKKIKETLKQIEIFIQSNQTVDRLEKQCQDQIRILYDVIQNNMTLYDLSTFSEKYTQYIEFLNTHDIEHSSINDYTEIISQINQTISELDVFIKERIQVADMILVIQSELDKYQEIINTSSNMNKVKLQNKYNMISQWLMMHPLIITTPLSEYNDKLNELNDLSNEINNFVAEENEETLLLAEIDKLSSTYIDAEMIDYLNVIKRQVLSHSGIQVAKQIVTELPECYKIKINLSVLKSKYKSAYNDLKSKNISVDQSLIDQYEELDNDKLLSITQNNLAQFKEAQNILTRNYSRLISYDSMTAYKLITSIYTTQLRDCVTEYNQNKPDDDQEIELPESCKEIMEYFSVERSAEDLPTAITYCEKLIEDWNFVYTTYQAAKLENENRLSNVEKRFTKAYEKYKNYIQIPDDICEEYKQLCKTPHFNMYESYQLIKSHNLLYTKKVKPLINQYLKSKRDDIRSYEYKFKDIALKHPSIQSFVSKIVFHYDIDDPILIDSHVSELLQYESEITEQLNDQSNSLEKQYEIIYISITQEDVHNRQLNDYIRETSLPYLRKYQSKSQLIRYINEKHLSSVLQLVSLFDVNNQYSDIIANNVISQYETFFENLRDTESLMEKYNFLTLRCDMIIRYFNEYLEKRNTYTNLVEKLNGKKIIVKDQMEMMDKIVHSFLYNFIENDFIELINELKNNIQLLRKQLN